MRLVRPIFGGEGILVWNWPVFDFTFLRWSHEDSDGVRVRFGFFKFTWIKRVVTA